MNMSQMTLKYSVNYHLADLGWIDFELDGSPILPRCSTHSAKLSYAQSEFVRQWNGQNQGQPNSGTRGDGSPCIYLDFNDERVGLISGRRLLNSGKYMNENQNQTRV